MNGSRTSSASAESSYGARPPLGKRLLRWRHVTTEACHSNKSEQLWATHPGPSGPICSLPELRCATLTDVKPVSTTLYGQRTVLDTHSLPCVAPSWAKRSSPHQRVTNHGLQSVVKVVCFNERFEPLATDHHDTHILGREPELLEFCTLGKSGERDKESDT